MCFVYALKWPYKLKYKSSDYMMKFLSETLPYFNTHIALNLNYCIKIIF